MSGSTAKVHPNDRAKKLLVKGVPADLRKLLIDKVEADESNLNDVAVQILADALGVRYRGGSGRTSMTRINALRRGRNGNAPTSLVLEMPEQLHYKISADAVKLRTNRTQLVIKLLSDALGKRRPRRRAA